MTISRFWRSYWSYFPSCRGGPKVARCPKGLGVSIIARFCCVAFRKACKPGPPHMYLFPNTGTGTLIPCMPISRSAHKTLRLFASLWRSRDLRQFSLRCAQSLHFPPPSPDPRSGEVPEGAPGTTIQVPHPKAKGACDSNEEALTLTASEYSILRYCTRVFLQLGSLPHSHYHLMCTCVCMYVRTYVRT